MRFYSRPRPRRPRAADGPELDLGYATVDPEVATLIQAAGKKPASAGAIIEGRDPGFPDPASIFRAHWFTGAASVRAGVPHERRRLLIPDFS